MSAYSTRTNGRGRGVKPEKTKPPNPPGRSNDQTPRQPGQATGVDSRLLFASQVMIGYKVEVQVKGGEVYEGILNTIQYDKPQDKLGGDMHVVLKMAKLLREPSGKTNDRQSLAERPVKELIIYSRDLVQIIAKDVKMAAADVGPVQKEDVAGFDIDAAIGKGRQGLVGRELTKWMPEPGDEGVSLDTWEETGPGWDQFAQNQKLFGVTTTYDENLYTSALDKAKSKITEEEASRIAREIEGGSAHNFHVLEERGIDNGDQIDEEDRYSSVVRSAPVAVPSQPVRNHHPHPAPATNGAFLGPTEHLLPAARAVENGTGTMPRLPAWFGDRAGVAAVAGRTLSSNAGPSGSQPPPPPHHPPHSTVPQLAADSFRAPVNKFRQEIVAGRKPQGASLYGSSPGRTPVASFLSSNPIALEALNLNPGSTRYSAETKKDFYKFKNANQEVQRLPGDVTMFGVDKVPQPRHPRVAPSSKLDEHNTSDHSIPNKALELQALAFPPPPPPPRAPEAAATPAPAATSTSDKSATGDNKTAAASSSSSAPAGQEAPKKPFKWNVNAKEFRLNPKAKEFVPGKVVPPEPAAAAATAPVLSTATTSAPTTAPLSDPATTAAVPAVTTSTTAPVVSAPVASVSAPPAPTMPPAMGRPASGGAGPLNRPTSSGAVPPHHASHGPRAHLQKHDLPSKHLDEPVMNARYRDGGPHASGSQQPHGTSYGSPSTSFGQHGSGMQHGMHGMAMQPQMAQAAWAQMPMAQWPGVPVGHAYNMPPGGPGMVAYMQPQMMHNAQMIRGAPGMQGMPGPGYLVPVQQMQHGRPTASYGSYPFPVQTMAGMQGMQGHMQGQHMAPPHHDNRGPMPPRGMNNRDNNRRFSNNREARPAMDDRHD